MHQYERIIDYAFHAYVSGRIQTLVRERWLNHGILFKSKVCLKRGFVIVDFALFVLLKRKRVFLFREQVYRD